jgi:hypothetical protein
MPRTVLMYRRPVGHDMLFGDEVDVVVEIEPTVGSGLDGLSRNAQAIAGLSGSPQFDKLIKAFKRDPGLRQETEWAYRLAVEAYNPSDRGLRFITGGIGEWIVTLAAYQAGIVTLPEGHNADGHDTLDLLQQSRELWSVKTSYAVGGSFTITNGQGGAGAGLTVPTIFLAPGLPGIVYVHPGKHPAVVAQQREYKDSMKLEKCFIKAHADDHPECVIPFDMPLNPGSKLVDPGLEAVRLLLDGPQFPRLSAMFRDSKAQADSSYVSQLRELEGMLTRGALTAEQYRRAVQRITQD